MKLEFFLALEQFNAPSSICCCCIKFFIFFIFFTFYLFLFFLTLTRSPFFTFLKMAIK